MQIDDKVLNWLLNSDPAIIWQVKRDLLDLSSIEYQNDLQQVSTTGWGADLLSRQDPEGTWGGGYYGPKFISTHYTLLLLRRMGMLPNRQTSIGCLQLLRMPFIGGLEPEKPSSTTGIGKELCITGMALGILSHFETGIEHFPAILEFLNTHQMQDGGWNCRQLRTEPKSKHSSMHTTLSVLEGLHLLHTNFPKHRKLIASLRAPAHQFLLDHELYKSHHTGEIAHKDFVEITFPPRWKYNLLSALDYFRAIGAEPDSRMKDAINILRDKERNGYWYKGKQMSGKQFFSLNKPRQPSEWNTLRALRVLKWWSQP